MTKVRSAREQAWQLLRRQWIDGEDINAEARAIDAERELPDAFEVRVINADKLADRLRREADRVHTQASLLAEQENVKQRTNEIVQKLEKFTAEKKQKDAEWEALWAPCDIQPRTPHEMRAWLDKLEKLRDRVGQLTLLQQQINDSKHIRDTNIKLLKQQLQNLGKEASDSASLEAVLLESEEVLDELDKIKRQQEVLDNAINTMELKIESNGKEYQAASNELDVWKAQWKKAVEGFGLEVDALPSEVTDIIDKLRDLFDKQREAQNMRIRIQAIDDYAESFRKQVGSVVKSVAPELAKLPADEAVAHLNALLLENRTRQSQRQHIEEQLQQAQQNIQDSEATIQIMTERMDALCVDAKCDNHSELEEAERRSDEHLRLKEEVRSVEQGILEEGEGATLAELETEAKGVNPDTIPGQIETLTSKIEEEQEPRRMALAENKGRLVKELELMDGSDHAAALADQGQSVLANIRSNSEQYVRLKLAAKILRDEIERYRQENQGPLVKSASEHFAVLTRGSFNGLMTDFNEKDEPVLVGIRPNEERVHVEGMSSGTRDQLYLALRLAALEKYMENSEPMPFIVDDILVDFDDERSEAALTALAQLAQTTQVILFTHHSLVVEQAKKLGVSISVHIHEL